MPVTGGHRGSVEAVAPGERGVACTGCVTRTPLRSEPSSPARSLVATVGETPSAVISPGDHAPEKAGDLGDGRGRVPLQLFVLQPEDLPRLGLPPTTPPTYGAFGLIGATFRMPGWKTLILEMLGGGSTALPPTSRACS